MLMLSIQLRQTSQLQPIPLMSATSHDNPTFAAATLVAPAAITGSVAIPLHVC